MNTDFIVVAHRDRLLATLDGPLGDSMLASWPLACIANQTGDGQTMRDAWTFSTTDAAIDMMTYQAGFGWPSGERVRPHFDQDVLRRLLLSHGARRATSLYLIVKRDLAPIDEQVATLLGLFRAF